MRKCLFSDCGSSLGLLILRVGFGSGIITCGHDNMVGGMGNHITGQRVPASALLAAGGGRYSVDRFLRGK